jgi:hypothetical protein
VERKQAQTYTRSLSFIVVHVTNDTASGGCRGTEAGSEALSIFQYRVVERKYVSEKKLECVRYATAVANSPLHETVTPRVQTVLLVRYNCITNS